ncbi:MAG: HU family DNA-binding protein [Balneolaceae bacterium]
MEKEKEFIHALREVMREEMIQKNTVVIQGLGRFENVHEQQKQKTTEEGKVYMVPPRDRVVFTPEKRAEE